MKNKKLKAILHKSALKSQGFIRLDVHFIMLQNIFFVYVTFQQQNMRIKKLIHLIRSLTRFNTIVLVRQK